MTPQLRQLDLVVRLRNAGYVGVSNRHLLIARIDREDWLIVMATALRRAPADFYVPGAKEPAHNWADHYRRCFSGDKMPVTADIYRLMPRAHDGPCVFLPKGDLTP